LVIDRDLFAGLDVAQGDEEDMTVENLHEGVGLAGMIDVVGAVTITAAIETPAFVDGTDAQLAPACPAVYSAIFRRPLKWATEKQPFPTMGDFLIARPGASLSFMFIQPAHSTSGWGQNHLRERVALIAYAQNCRPPAHAGGSDQKAAALFQRGGQSQLISSGNYFSLKLRAIKSV
jgi:hypothetical protein